MSPSFMNVVIYCWYVCEEYKVYPSSCLNVVKKIEKYYELISAFIRILIGGKSQK